MQKEIEKGLVGEEYMNKISVIIATRNRPHDLIRCVESILSQTLLPDELIIVDDSDVLEVKPKLESLDGINKLSFKYLTGRSHIAIARNMGVDNASGDIIMIADDDTILDKNYIEEIASVLYNDTEGRVGAVFGESIEGRTEQRKDNFIRRILSKLLGHPLHTLSVVFFLHHTGNGKFLPSGASTVIKPNTLHEITELECLFGNFFAMRRETFNEFRLYEEFPWSWGFDDDDLAYRISRKYVNIYNPRAKLIHNRSPKRFDPKNRMRVLIYSHYFFYKKNLPKTFKYKAAFYWSMVGWFIMAIMRTVTTRDHRELKGLISGYRDIVKGIDLEEAEKP